MGAMLSGRSLVDLASDGNEIAKRSDEQQRRLQLLLFSQRWPDHGKHLKLIRNGYSCNMLNISKGKVVNQQVRALQTQHQLN